MREIHRVLRPGGLLLFGQLEVEVYEYTGPNKVRPTDSLFLNLALTFLSRLQMTQEKHFTPGHMSFKHRALSRPCPAACASCAIRLFLSPSA